MENQSKWSKELLYSIIFLLLAYTWFTLNPFAQIRDMTNQVYSVLIVMKLGFFFFIIFSLYYNIKALKKASKDDKKIFAIIPNNAPFGAGLIVLLLSVSLTTFITLLLTGVIKY